MTEDDRTPDAFVCCFCGYEPMDPDGIYAETFDAHMCVDCEEVATRLLVSVAEAGQFTMRGVTFDVRPCLQR